MSSSFPLLQRVWGLGGAWLLYCALNWASAVFVWAIVPETEGLSLEEIHLSMRAWRRAPAAAGAAEATPYRRSRRVPLQLGLGESGGNTSPDNQHQVDLGASHEDDYEEESPPYGLHIPSSTS